MDTEEQIINYITSRGQIILNELIKENRKTNVGRVSSLKPISYFDYKKEYHEQCADLIQYVELFWSHISYSNIFANVYIECHYKFYK